ncbi:MAG: TadE/TadG family type IV pilus assembly protein [Candidatus Sericytochromatia bacterium]|nr:TadE/TadG family type IV pilus assembly protein [Candidatus Sericytochromatia bacterium]
MNCCTDRSSPRGQALVEMAIVLPVGVLLLLVVGYLGKGLLERQQVVMAARHAARTAAHQAMAGSAAKITGAGVLQSATGMAGRTAAVRDLIPEGMAKAPDWSSAVAGTATTHLRPRPLGPGAMGYVATQVQQVEGRAMTFGLGFILYGAKAESRMRLLEPLRRQVQGVARQVGRPPSGLAAPLAVSAQAFMPGELPVHHPQVGLLEQNRWIREIVEGP